MKNLPAQLIILIVVLCFGSCESSSKKNESAAQHNAEVAPQNAAVKKNSLKHENSLINFIPKGYFILDSLIDKMDEYNSQHIVLVCAPISEKNTDEFIETNRRLILLQKKGDMIRLLSSNDALILCKSCGGIFGDPYNGITLKNNVLTISNYGGSAWRWSENYTFRFQGNEWQLIGATYDSYFNAKACKGEVGIAGHQLEDINFASGKMHIIHTQDDNCEPFEDYWKNFGKKKPISLNNFPGAADQWPSNKIKDGDGKE